MKRAAITALVVSLFAGSAAMAGQGFHGRADNAGADHRQPPRSVQNGRHDQRNGHFDGRRGDYGRNDNYRPSHPNFRPASPRYVYRPAPSRYGVYHAPRGYYAHTWRRGDRLPVAYYQRPYVIADYRDCGLRAPPRGYHWVRVNGDAVLAAVATGIVLESVFHIF
jgi:Ni/Co efflux regulator RcnB